MTQEIVSTLTFTPHNSRQSGIGEPTYEVKYDYDSGLYTFFLQKKGFAKNSLHHFKTMEDKYFPKTINPSQLIKD